MVQPANELNPPPPVTTPRLAPWEHVEELIKRLDRLIAILEQWVPTVPGVPVVPVTVTTVWEAADAVELYREALRQVITTHTEMINWKTGKRLLLSVNNKLDQDIIIQPVGSIKASVLEATDVGPPFPCSAKGRISIGFAWDDWHPYIGARIIVAVAPTDGSLNIWAVIQE